MIDPRSETLLSLSAAAGEFPGGKRHICTLHRYRLHGIKKVHLDCIWVGGKWFTSREAIDRFIRDLNAVPSTTQAAGAADGFLAAESGLDAEGGFGPPAT